MVFGVPICRAEQRRVGGSIRPSAVRAPQQATSCVACQGEFRWTPGKPSSARKKRKLGCISFGYLFFVQAKKSNSPKGRKATVQTRANTRNYGKNIPNNSFKNRCPFNVGAITPLVCANNPCCCASCKVDWILRNGNPVRC